MSELYEVSSEQLTDITGLVQGLFKEVSQLEGCSMDPGDIAGALRAVLQTIEVNRQLPRPTGSFNPDDFLYLSLPDHVLRRPIEELGLSTAVHNCLERVGANNLGLLLEWTEADLLDLRNFGRKSLDEVIGKLGKDLHLSRRNQDIDPPAGDEWVDLRGRTVLRSRLSHVFVDSLRSRYDDNDHGAGTKRVLYQLRIGFHVERVGALLTYTPADISAFDWEPQSVKPEDALRWIKNTLAGYDLQLRTP